MTNAVAQITNSVSPINGLDVVNAVNGFYSGAFTNIAWLLGILVTLFGIAIGAIYYLLQNLQLKLQKEKLEKRFAADFAVLEKTLREKTLNLFESEKMALRQELVRMENELTQKNKNTMAGVFYLAAETQFRSGNIKGALMGYAQALESVVEGKALTSIQSLLKHLTVEILPTLTKKDFKDESIKNSFDKALELTAKLKEQLLGSDIEDVKKALVEAQKREPK